MTRREGGGDDSRTERAFASQDAMTEWLKEHPVEIPEPILQSIRDWEQQADQAKSAQEFGETLERRKQHIERLDDVHRLYWRLYHLRKGRARHGEVRQVEEALSTCYCGSALAYNICHGV